jgi:NitT/TauT family transport system permease protein
LSPTTLAGPGAVWATLLRLSASGQLWLDIGTSGVEFLAGYLPAIVIGVLVGMALGLVRRLETALTPYLMGLYATPFVAFISVLLAWFGVGLFTKALMIFLLAFFPISVNTITGVKSVDPVLLKAGRSFGANRFELLTRIVFPSTLPYIFAGMQVAVGRGLIGMFVGEFFGSYTGLGATIIRSTQEFRPTVTYAEVIVMALLSIMLSELIRLLGHRLAPWRQELVL